MTFPYPNNPDDWQAAYTRERAYRDSDKRSFSLLLVMMIPLAVVFLYSIFFVQRYAAEGHSGFVFFTVTILIVISILVFFLLVQKWAFQCSEKFFSKFYLPPEGISPRKLINYRLYGKTRLPEPFNRLSHFQYIIAKDGNIEKKDQWPAWLSFNVGGPILLIVFDGCALYLERGNRFSRVVGPGDKAPFLEWHETIKYVVDLRPKVKTDCFNVWTKDGINIKLTVRIEARIGDPAKHDPTSDLVYPFDPVAVKKAIERYALRWPDPQKEPSEFTWVDAVWGQVTGVIPSYIGGRFLDDLLMAEKQSGQILSSEALSKILEGINKSTQGFGVFVTDMQIVKVELPEEVRKLQEEYWKAERESITKINEGRAKAFSIRTQEKSRAVAQRDFILAIAEGLEKNKSNQYMEPLLLSLSSILDESLGDPLLRAYLAKETLDTLEKLQTMLEKPPSE